MNVIKRDGHTETWDSLKIEKAIIAAGAEPLVAHQVTLGVERELSYRDGFDTTVEEIHNEVEKNLMPLDREATKRYMNYRDRKRAVPAAIADYIHAAKYRRGTETWQDTVVRLYEMYQGDFPDHDLSEMMEAIEHKKVLPSMRSLQFGGRPIHDHNARMFNCSFTRIDRLRSFAEIYYLLLCGCGVGFSAQKHHVASLPPLIEVDKSIVLVHSVEDTIEGWADAIQHLMNGAITGFYAEFDYSRIRPYGSPLKSSGGLAPGHVPLKTAIERCRSLLIGEWTPLKVMDIICHIADSVRAGGIRRSSLACLFDTMDIHTSKIGDWYKDNPQRSMVNISRVMRRSTVTIDEVNEIVDSAKQFGEPGFFFTDDVEHGTNPCYEIGLNPPPGGIAFCNLTEVNCATVSSEADFLDRCRIAARIGTFQATYTKFKYIADGSAAARDALLGVSLTGVVDCPIELTDDLLQRGREAAIAENRRVAQELGINAALRVTCIKPSGTASLLLGCVGSGIHPHHAKKYLRRVTAGENEPCFIAMRKANPEMCVRKPNGDWVIEFPVETKGLIRSDFDAIGMLEHALRFQRHWVGAQEAPSHNVSVTVTVKDHEWGDVAEWIYGHREELTAVSLLGDFVNYPFAPREEVSEFKVGYNPVEYSTPSDGDAVACEGPLCEL